MEIQSLSQTNSPYFSGNIKLPKSHIERIKAFTQRSTLAPQKDILIFGKKLIDLYGKENGVKQ